LSNEADSRMPRLTFPRNTVATENRCKRQGHTTAWWITCDTGLASLLTLCALGLPQELLPISAEQAQNDPARFTVESSLVRLDVQVDEGSRLVSGLHADDFWIFDEQQRQRTVYFTSEHAPVDILFLLDVSASIRPAAEELARASLAAFNVLNPDDRVALMKFGRRGKLLVPFTKDREVVVAALRKLVSSGFWDLTDLYRSLDDASRYLWQSRVVGENMGAGQPRRVIVMITDGIGGPDKHEALTLRNLWEADAIVDVLIVGPTWEQINRAQHPPPYNPQNLQRIADRTGGTVTSTKRVDATLPEMLQRCRTRYSLFYRTPNGTPGSFRHVHVMLTPEIRQEHPSARVHTRAGYYLPK
jgi:VWFA-related protein